MVTARPRCAPSPCRRGPGVADFEQAERIALRDVINAVFDAQRAPVPRRAVVVRKLGRCPEIVARRRDLIAAVGSLVQSALSALPVGEPVSSELRVETVASSGNVTTNVTVERMVSHSPLGAYEEPANAIQVAAIYGGIVRVTRDDRSLRLELQLPVAS